MSRDLDSEEMGGTFDEPPNDNRERAEADWLLARNSDPTAAPPSAATAREYEELEHLLGSMPDGPSDQSWHEEILKKAAAQPAADEGIGIGEIVPIQAPSPSRARRAWWKGAAARWAGGSFATLAAAAAVLTFVMFSKGNQGETQDGDLLVATINEGGVRGEPTRAAALDIKSRRGDVRVFRKTTSTSTGYEYARCSTAGDLCKVQGEQVIFHVELTQTGFYSVVWAERTVEIAEGATLEEFERAASKQGVKTQRKEEVERR